MYRGAAAAARAYVEADRSRVDDYYLAEGTGLARRFGASPHGVVADLGLLEGEGYERWVAGHDPETGAARGRLRRDANAVRFVEITVNGPKTWSLAAALDPEVAGAFEAAQDRAAEQIIGWVADHATTRVGPRGRQVQVGVERIEAATVRHYTSRAGDPHRHLHLQVNARVFAEGKWRGLHTVGFRDSIEALNGIGHAAVMTDPEFRAALASAGFTLDPASGEVAELAPYVGGFSERAAQIGRNIDRYEAQWRRANPGQEPGPTVRQSWDRRAWKDARPDKVIPADGAAMVSAWVEHLHELGYRDPSPQPRLPVVVGAPRVGGLDRDAAVEAALMRLGAHRSAWNAADVRGEIEKSLAATGLVADARVRLELAEDLTARAIGSCVPLIHQTGVPEHIRSLTSARVLGVEADIVARLADRSQRPVSGSISGAVVGEGLDEAQREAVAVLTGDAQLVVVEGAAGAGKTTTLSATRAVLTGQGRGMVVVTPTLKAAQVVRRELGTDGTNRPAASVAWLVHQHGFRWDDDGRWTRVESTPADQAQLVPGDLLLVDEAGMLDQDTAQALLTVADETGARVAFVGDRHQLPAVGRGGVLDLAARWVDPEARADLDGVHRFADPEYAAISLALRLASSSYVLPTATRSEGAGEPVEASEGLTTRGRDQTVTEGKPVGDRSGERVGEVWDALCRRDQIRIYASEIERTHALAQLAVESVLTGHDRGDGVLVIADTREQSSALNGVIRDRLVAAGYLDDARALVTHAGERLGVGDRVATRRNDHYLGVSNRDVWTVSAVEAEGRLTLRGRRATDLHTVSPTYARNHVELAYATTVYGAQGDTTGAGHLLLGEHTSAASAYVGMTRGRDDNVVHLVAENLEGARRQWDEVFSRDRADLGPAVAALQAADSVDRYGVQKPTRPLDVVLADLRDAWSKQADLAERAERLAGERDALQQVARIRARYAPDRERLRDIEDQARRKWIDARHRMTDLQADIDATTVGLRERVWNMWREDVHLVRSAAVAVSDGSGRLGRRRRQVRQASDELVVFADKWRPVVPDLPTEAAALAARLVWLHARRVENHVNAYVAERVAAAHPTRDALRQVERDASRALDQAETDRSRFDRSYYRELEPCGRAAHSVEIPVRLASVVSELTQTDHELDAVTRQLQRFEDEPALRDLPSGGLADEHAAWANERTDHRAAAAREAQLRRRRRQEAVRMEPVQRAPSGPHPGLGFGR